MWHLQKLKILENIVAFFFFFIKDVILEIKTKDNLQFRILHFLLINLALGFALSKNNIYFYKQR